MHKHRSMLLTMAILALLSLVLTTGGALAQAGPSNTTLPYAGHLTDETGTPVAAGQYDFQFALYDAEKDGQRLWSETQGDVAVQDGAVTVALGTTVVIPKEVRERKALWLAVSVRGPLESNYTTLEPRQRIDTITGPTATTALACPHNHFTDYWPGTNSDYGLLLENVGTGDGLRAYSKSTVWNYAAVFGANVATTGYGTGVYGYSSNGAGVFANSNSGDALEATTASTTKSAVYAHAVNANGVWGISTNKQGVHGGSTTNFGVEATGGGDASYADLIGDLLMGGTRGEIFVTGNVAELYSNGYIAFDLDNDNNSANQLEVWNGAEALVFKVDESGNTTATGTKSASANTANYGQRLLYAVESPEVRLEDFGSAELLKGTVTVKIEPIFAETVNLKEAYQVFLTPLGDCALYVAEKTPTSFSVQALGGQTCSIAFDYRIVARRLGYEQIRLAPDTNHTSRSPEAQP
jgi:hypothetical protein